MGKKLDINKLKEKLGEPISSKEALEDVIHFNWSKDVLAEKKEIAISKVNE